MANGLTKYSRLVGGTRANHNLSARFDLTDGFLGITQFDSNTKKSERVLLNRKQVAEMLQFINGKKQRNTP